MSLNVKDCPITIGLGSPATSTGWLAARLSGLAALTAAPPSSTAVAMNGTNRDTMTLTLQVVDIQAA